MNAGGTAGRLLVSLALMVLLAGCASSPPSVKKMADIPYERANPPLVPGMLDVYAPAKAGPWPVVVMLHSPEGDKAEMGGRAGKVADLGFVVFTPNWGGGISAVAPTHDGLLAINSQAACAVAFARAHAADYGGDPATMIVFGHSGGAMVAAQVAFARPEPSAGCLGGNSLGAIDALVTWEGSWVLSVPSSVWDGPLAADPRVLDAQTVWPYVAAHRDLKVVILVSEHPGPQFERKVGDPWAADSWLAARDPSGDLRRQLEASGAFADGTLDLAEVQQLLFSVLKAQGNPVSLDVMPGSTHADLSGEGWKVFLAAFPKAAAQD